MISTQDLISVQVGSSKEGLNNVSVLLLNKAIILKSKLFGLSLLEHAQSRTSSHGNATSVLRVSGASEQLAPLGRTQW